VIAVVVAAVIATNKTATKPLSQPFASAEQRDHLILFGIRRLAPSSFPA